MLCICFVIFIPAFCWDFSICWGGNLGRKPKSCSKRCQQCSFQGRTGTLPPFDGSYPTVILPRTTSWECDTACGRQSLEVLTMNCRIKQHFNSIMKTKCFYKKKNTLINCLTWLRDYQGTFNLSTLGWTLSHKEKPPPFSIKSDIYFKR